MFFKEDNTYNDLREKAIKQWLDEMQNHEDKAVKAGVEVTREYILYLKNKIESLKAQGELKDDFLKKMKEKVNNK